MIDIEGKTYSTRRSLMLLELFFQFFSGQIFQLILHPKDGKFAPRYKTTKIE